MLRLLTTDLRIKPLKAMDNTASLKRYTHLLNLSSGTDGKVNFYASVITSSALAFSETTGKALSRHC